MLKIAFVRNLRFLQVGEGIVIHYLFKSQSKGFYVNGKSKMTSARHAARYIGRYMARPALESIR